VPDRSLPTLQYRTRALASAEAAFAEVKRQQQRLVAEFPSNYDYLRRIHGDGQSASRAVQPAPAIPARA
jgi:hypothetical protein